MSLKEKLLSLNIFEDNEYLDCYINLIEQNRETKKEQFKTALHHIIPKAYFKKMNLPIDNSKDNLVNLLHKDHVLAHYYIALSTKDKYFLYSSMSALQHIMGFNKKMKQEDITNFISNLDKYQELVEQKNKYHSEHTKGLLAGEKNPAKRPEVREKIRLAKLGNTNNLGKHIHDNQWKKEQSQRMKGHKHSVETRKKLSDSHKGQVAWNKGKKLSEEHRKKLSEAKKGKSSWNKGKHLTEEQKKHLSEINKGKKGTFLGKHHNEKTKQLISLKNKGIKRSNEFKDKLSKSMKGRIAVHDIVLNKTKYIKQEDIAKFIEQGYVLGGAKRFTRK